MPASNSMDGPRETPDALLLFKSAREGNEEAFGELVKMYHERIYNTAYAIVGHAEDAREVEQQTWIKAWRNLPRFHAGSSFYTWVYRIAVNTALDWMRSRARRREDPMPEAGPEALACAMAEHAPSQAPRPDRMAEQSEFRERFDKALEQLSPEHRAAIVLREVDGLSYEEIAGIMGCRVGTVMSRIFYARRQLQELLKDAL